MTTKPQDGEWIAIERAHSQQEVLVCREGMLGWHAVAILRADGVWLTAGLPRGYEFELRYKPTHFMPLAIPPSGIRAPFHKGVQ